MDPTQKNSTAIKLIKSKLMIDDERDIPSILHLSIAEDGSTGLAYSEIWFKKANGGSDSLLLRRDDALDAGKLLKELQARNAVLPPDDKQAKSMLHEVGRKDPLQSLTHEASLGWNSGGDFVTLDRVIGNKTNQAPPIWIKKQPPFRLKRSGTSEDWTRKVGKFALSSSRGALALAAGFAAPTLKIIGKNSFAIVFFGKSRTGKSTASVAAASIIGIDTEDSMPNWNITEAGFQQTARLFNDQLFPMNELALLKSGAKGSYSQVRDATYRFGEGVEIVRHSESGYATSGIQSNWRAIMITSNEHSIDEMATMSGVQRDEGEQVRAFCVPAVASGYRTVIDSFPAKVDAAGQDEWSQKRFARLRRDAETCHGVVFDDYIAFLMAKGHASIRDFVLAATDDFLQSLDFKIESPALRDVARNFGIIYAGGLLGIEGGFLPISKARLQRSVTKCLRDGLDALRPIREIEKDAVVQFRAKIDDVSWPARKAVAKAGEATTFSFVLNKADSEPCRAVTTVTFQSWFESKAHARAALRWLHREKLLVLKDGADLTKSDFGIESATKNVKVGGESTRCIVFRNPSSSGRKIAA